MNMECISKTGSANTRLHPPFLFIKAIDGKHTIMLCKLVHNSIVLHVCFQGILISQTSGIPSATTPVGLTGKRLSP